MGKVAGLNGYGTYSICKDIQPLKSSILLISASVFRLAISTCIANDCDPNVSQPLVLNSVVSRLQHGTATFDVNLPPSAPYGIECRGGNPTGSKKLVFTFSNQLASVARASVAIGAATVSGSSGIDSDDPHIYNLVLANVADLQQLVVMLEGVADTSGNKVNVSATMRVIVGDTTASASVNSSDVSQIKLSSGAPLSQTNFRRDLNSNGAINSSDVSLVKVLSGRALSDVSLPKLQVCGKYLCKADGSPFFWLGDTAWWLMNLSDSEVSYFLAKRASQGFTGIQMMATMQEYPASANAEPALHCRADYYGNLPEDSTGHLTPNENSPYWARLKRIVTEAEQKGLYVGLSLVHGSEISGDNVLLRYFDDPSSGGLEQALAYGTALGALLRDRPNVWYLVSLEYDAIAHFNPSAITSAQFVMFDKMAEGLAASSQPSSILRGIHPGSPQSSVAQFGVNTNNGNPHPTSWVNWIDFHMLQSGHHFTDYPDDCVSPQQTDQLIDAGLADGKPILDAEPIYEDAVDNAWSSCHGPFTRRANASLARFKGYEAVFAGAFGHTYGHQNVCTFYTVGVDDNVHPPFHRGIHWTSVIDTDGANQMRYLRQLMECHSQNRIPDQSVITSSPGPYGLSHIRATRDSSDGAVTTPGTYALLYLPQGGSVTINMAKQSGPTLARWFNPEDGTYSAANPCGTSPCSNFGTQTFTSPPARHSPLDYVNDWILVLELENFHACP
jgi:hypothetical protein